MVVSCEALKPKAKRIHNARIYDVVATLVGLDSAEHLQNLPLPPQKVRGKHLHRGELFDRPLESLLLGDPFGDPTFDEMLRTLAYATRQCLIEWLRRGGLATMTLLPRPDQDPTLQTDVGNSEDAP
jgi:hypothetical protein